MSESIQIALADLKEWLQKEITPLIKPLKDRGKSLLNEVKKRLDDVREIGDRILVKSEKELQKGSSKTYRCAKAANKMSKNIVDMLNQLAISSEISYENFRLLLGDLEKTLASIRHERIVWYRRISPYFILDRRRLDIAIKRAEDSIQELRSFLFQKYVKAKTAENTLALVDKLSQLIEEAENVQKRKSQAETRAKLLEEKIRENEQKIGLIQDKAELNELSQLEKQIGDLKEKVKYNLRHLQKPFYKLQSLARGARVALPPDEARKLEQYMKTPFEALVTEEEGHPLLRRILHRVEDAIRRGKLKLKPTRLRKAREQMESILRKDALNPLQHDCVEATLRRKHLLTLETVATTQKELRQLHAALQDLQREKESVDSRMRSLKEEHQRMLERIRTQKSEVERAILKLTGKRVRVVFTTK